MESDNTNSHFDEIEKDMRGSAYRLAAKNKRFINYFVDFIVVFFLFVLSRFVISFFSGFTGIDIHKLMEEELGFGLYLNSVFIIIQTMYYTFSEFFSGKTFGKLLTNTHVVKVNGDKLDFKTSFIRSLARLIPVDAFSYLDKSRGWHDSISKTCVVNNE